MLRRNIDTKNGLVNGAIGTVQKISVATVTDEFNHIDKTYGVEKVNSRFMVYKRSRHGPQCGHTHLDIVP